MTALVSTTSPQRKQKTCVALLCDEGYLFPTLTCARQIHQNIPSDTDLIILLDAPGFDRERLEKLERISGASIQIIPPTLGDEITKDLPAGFFSTHLSRAALFRLYVGKLLDKRYDKILYMDGDIQVRRSLAPLLDMPLADGMVAAVPDWQALHSLEGMSFREGARAYLSGLDLSNEQMKTYFNSGVMMASPETWNSIGPAALEFMVARPEACKWHDQSALNHACRERVTPVSVRWNFLRQYLPLPSYRTIDPAVIHFVGKLKPWDGAFAPWGRTEFMPYVQMAHQLEGLGIVWRRKPPKTRLLYHIKPFVRGNEYSDPVYKAKLDQLLVKMAKLPGTPAAAA